MKTSTINRYVPELVDQLIIKSDFKHKEHLYIITDMLTRVTMFRNIKYNNDYIDIAARYFTDIISDDTSFKAAMNFLKENNIIQCDEIFSKDLKKAKGYRFNQDLVSKCIKIKITTPTLVRRIIANKNERNNAVNDLLKPNKDYFLKTFSIKYRPAIKYIEDLYIDELHKATTDDDKISCIHRYNSYYITINTINDGELYFRPNQTNYRVDTNLTSLKKELKQFINIPDIYQLDIVNSQPFMLYFFVKKMVKQQSSNNNNSNLISTHLCHGKLKDEMAKYLDWCRFGLFYENFKIEAGFNGKVINYRKEVKEIIYKILFSKNEHLKNNKAAIIFQSIFPHLFKFITEYKATQHNKLAIDLQSLESSICIYKVVPLLNEAKIKHYTIHDAWLMDRLDTYKAEQIIKEVFYQEFGVEPKIVITKIT